MPIDLTPGEYRIVRAGANSAVVLMQPVQLYEPPIPLIYGVRLLKTAWDQLPRGALKSLMTKQYTDPSDFENKVQFYLAQTGAGLQTTFTSMDGVGWGEYRIDFDVYQNEGDPNDGYPFVTLRTDTEYALCAMHLAVNYSASE